MAPEHAVAAAVPEGVAVAAAVAEAVGLAAAVAVRVAVGDGSWARATDAPAAWRATRTRVESRTTRDRVASLIWRGDNEGKVALLNRRGLRRC
jgi:hypothetical protein